MLHIVHPTRTHISVFMCLLNIFYFITRQFWEFDVRTVRKLYERIPCANTAYEKSLVYDCDQNLDYHENTKSIGIQS